VVGPVLSDRPSDTDTIRLVSLVPLIAFGVADVRSTARTGAGDLGRNASPIRRFLDDLGE